MADAVLDAFEEIKSKDSLILVAFPTTGQASSIAAQYLVRQLGLPLVGHVRLPDLQNVVSIQDGRVTSLVRLFGGEAICKLDRACPRIFVVTADLPMPPAVLAQIGALVLELARQGEAHLVLCLEGVVRGEGDDIPDVFCASADPQVLKELAATHIPPMERALIGGIAGPILLGAAGKGVRAGALLVEATRDHPDGRAAAALIAALQAILPDVAMDAKPLLEEALNLERELKQAIEATAPT
ncbi:MAG: PAC2 family protein, partial [Thermoplasmatota archaeon]